MLTVCAAILWGVLGQLNGVLSLFIDVLSLFIDVLRILNDVLSLFIDVLRLVLPLLTLLPHSYDLYFPFCPKSQTVLPQNGKEDFSVKVVAFVSSVIQKKLIFV